METQKALTEYRVDEPAVFSMGLPFFNHDTEHKGEHSTLHEMFICWALIKAP